MDMQVVIETVDPAPSKLCLCDYCGGPLKGEKVVIIGASPVPIPDYSSRFDLHRNCVLAFAARIQNEFEKL